MASELKPQKTITKTNATPPLPALAPAKLSLANNSCGAFGLGPKNQRHSLLPKSPVVEKTPEFTLAKPFTSKSRRILTNNTRRLIDRRTLVHQELLRGTRRKYAGVGGYIPSAKILFQQEQLQKQELRHLKKHTATLAERKRLYRHDPTEERAKDLYLIRTLLLRFRRNLRSSMTHIKAGERKPRSRNGMQESSSSASSSEHVAGKRSLALSKASGILPSGGNDSSAPNSNSDAAVATKKADGKRKRRNDDDLNYKTTKAMKAQGTATPSSAPNSDREDGELEIGKKDKKPKRMTSTLGEGAKEESVNSEKKLKNSQKEKKHKNKDGDGDDDHETTEGPVRKNKKVKNDKPRKIALPAGDAIDDITTSDNALVEKSKKAKDEKKGIVTKSEDTGSDKSELKGQQVPIIKISEPAASKSKTARQCSNDQNQHYFTRRRAEMLDDPLGFDDCVVDVPPHRRKKSHRHLPPAMMSGAINSGVAAEDHSSFPPGSKANSFESPQHKVKSSKKTKTRSENAEFAMTPALPATIQKQNAHHRSVGSSHSKHHSSRHESNDLRMKFNKHRKRSKSKSDGMGPGASDNQTGGGKSHATTDFPKSTNISISQQTAGKEDVCSNEKGDGAAAMKCAGLERGKDARIGVGTLDLRPASCHVDTRSPFKPKFSACSPRKIDNYANIYRRLTRVTNLENPVRFTPPQPHDVYSMQAGSGAHVNEPMLNKACQKKSGRDHKLSPNERSNSSMPSPDRSWWKQDRTAPCKMLYSSRVPESSSLPVLPSLPPLGGSSPKSMDDSPAKKSARSKFVLGHVSSPFLFSTSLIPLPAYVGQGSGNVTSNPTAPGLKKITPIPPPVLPPPTNSARKVAKEPKKITPIPPPVPRLSTGSGNSSEAKKTLCLKPPTYQPEALADMPNSPTLMVGAKRRAADDLVSIIQPTAGDTAWRTPQKRARKSTGSIVLSTSQTMMLNEKLRRDRKVLARESRRWKAMMSIDGL